MEENTVGLGSSRDDEIDFTFDEQEEDTVRTTADGDQQAESMQSGEHAAELSPNDQVGLDDALYDDDDEEDIPRFARDSSPGKPFTLTGLSQNEVVEKQEHDSEDEIDYDEDAQPPVAQGEQRESEHESQHELDHGERQKSGFQGQMHPAEGDNDGSFEEQPEDFDFDIENTEEGFVQLDDDDAEPRDEETEAVDTIEEYAGESAPHRSDPANTDSRNNSANMDQVARDLGADLGAFENPSPQVMVTWGGDVCPLFKLSDDADPSSFYLDDIAVLQRPLSGFLTAIRTNIARWIGEKDEIHVCIDELGIEFSETTISAFLEKVTFHNLLALHENLVQNDGNGGSRALHLTLRTKKNCALRLVELIEAANSGKGLSAIFSEPTSNMLSEPDLYGENVSHDEFHEDGSGQMDDTAGFFDEGMDEIGDGSHTLNTDRNDSRGISAASSPQPQNSADLGWAPDVGAGDLVACSEGTGLQQVSIDGNDVMGSGLDANAVVAEADSLAVPAVVAAFEPVPGEQIDLLGYSNEIVSQGIDEGPSAEDLLAEMDTGIAEVPALGGDNEAHLLDFTNDVVGVDGQELLGLDDRNHQFETAADNAAVNANYQPTIEVSQLDDGHGDEEYLDIGAADEGMDSLADISGNAMSAGATSKVTSEDHPLDLASHAEMSQSDIALGGDTSNGDHAGFAAKDATALLDQSAKEDDDEIDWDDEDKVIVPITPTSAIPNTNGKRTRDADEAEGMVDSGHDLKRHRPDQLLS